MSHSVSRVVFQAARTSQRQSPAAFFAAAREATNQYRSGGPIRTIYTRRWQPSSQVASTKWVVSRRSFSITAPASATVVKMNPRMDDDGNEMGIEISERAAKRLRQITSAAPTRNTLTSSPPAQDSHLRITVTSGGCHGFQYLMSLEDASKIDNEEDTIFQISDDAGEGRAEVVMDLPSLELLKGSTVDFTTELIGSQFKIIGNPRAKSSCGCGTSFDIA